MRHTYRCHLPPDASDSDHAVSERNGECCRLDPDLIDTARCPCCRAPLIARMGRDGPYFHCCCSSEELPQQSGLAQKLNNGRPLGSAAPALEREQEHRDNRFS